ncbi:M48 family metalloprotease [Streptomyces justiciae]|uniref:M48 family metalloprotease n=1 Tax=Streptomyces justiciae TaxID=2780140 RepID=UPI00187E1361|nr:M48 family metalloprotease [Streptomyces justiciae]MBE8478137.1 M48 family metalloprotease [Streptomyces justiciae]
MSQPPDPVAGTPQQQHPTAPPPPQYPATPPPPSYPTAAAPQYPTAPSPQYPTAPPPQYPTGPDAQYASGAAPQYYPAAPPPQYPTAPATPYPTAAPPQYPTTPPAPSTTPAPTPHIPPHPTPIPTPAPAPDDLDYRHLGSRVHVAAHQRGADATAIGSLLVHVPSLIVSAAVVGTIAFALFGEAGGWIVVLAWLATGGLVFHRPTELAFARRVLKLRAPLAQEQARLEPIWREVTARAGIEAHSYELMVENSPELNASAVAGHVVSVTTYALNEIPSSNLAAVLAHELGHHTGGHAWAGLLGYWYSLPGRIAWTVTKFVARIALAIAAVLSWRAYLLVTFVIGMCLVGGFVAAWYATLPLVLAPYLLAYTGRKAELRADQQAAVLGFAGQMTQVLYQLQAAEDREKAQVVAAGHRLKEPGAFARLLSTHPDNHTRIRALEPYLRTGL